MVKYIYGTVCPYINRENVINRIAYNTFSENYSKNLRGIELINSIFQKYKNKIIFDDPYTNILFNNNVLYINGMYPYSKNYKCCTKLSDVLDNKKYNKEVFKNYNIIKNSKIFIKNKLDNIIWNIICNLRKSSDYFESTKTIEIKYKEEVIMDNPKIKKNNK